MYVPYIIYYDFQEGYVSDDIEQFAPSTKRRALMSRKPQSVNELVNRDMNELIDAIQHKNNELLVISNITKELLNRFIEYPSLLSDDDPIDMCLFQIACRYDNVTAAQCLIQRGADINITNNAQWSGIMFACQYGSLDVVKFLVDSRVNLRQVNNEGMNLLHVACRYGQGDIVNYLCTLTSKRQRIFDVNAPDELDGYTPLLWCTDAYLDTQLNEPQRGHHAMYV